MKNRVYVAIDLKSYYASCEARERGLDPLTTNLVVADRSRTEKTICLAVSPSLKAYGIPGRARLFEVIQKLKEVNAMRRLHAPGRQFTGKSWNDTELIANPALEIDFITAVPQMALYMRKSTEIYEVYLKYVAPEDIFAYSVDEVFMDVTDYLKTYKLSAHDLTRKMIQDVLARTGITATAGIGSNLYLAKVAMDIWAKHVEADKDGVRIAELDEMSYRRLLWTHRPLTDFWRVGRGYAKKLEAHGIFTMGDVARCSLENEELLYKLFGVNAELLIDHAWGWENTRLSDVKAYKPENNSLSSGQVLQSPYPFDKAKLVTREMADALALELVDKGLAADQIVLTVGYDIENLSDPERRKNYRGPITTDRYGRQIPKHAHGSANLGQHTSSTRKIVDAAMEIFDRVVNPDLLVRRITITANHVMEEKEVSQSPTYEQMDLFTSFAEDQKRKEDAAALEREKKMQQALLAIKKKYGKNAILKGMSYEEGATGRDRNRQIGGHRM
ncbi:MAG: DNA methylase [Abditibacteriota bacterium]|nr:DNA methylase [Abditibacteriota bacterium]